MNITLRMRESGRRLGNWSPRASPAAKACTDALAERLGHALARCESTIPLALAGWAAIAAAAASMVLLLIFFAPLLAPAAALQSRLGKLPSMARAPPSPMDGPWGAKLPRLAASFLAPAAELALGLLWATCGSLAFWATGAICANALARSVAWAYGANPRLAGLHHGMLARAAGLNPYALLVGWNPGGAAPPARPGGPEASPRAFTLERTLAAWAAKPCGILGGWAMDCRGALSPIQAMEAAPLFHGFHGPSAVDWAAWAASLAEGAAIAPLAPPHHGPPTGQGARRL